MNFEKWATFSYFKILVYVIRKMYRNNLHFTDNNPIILKILQYRTTRSVFLKEYSSHYRISRYL